MHIESQHRSSPTVGRHPDRLAHSIMPARQNEEPSEHLSGGFSSILRACPLSMAVSLGTGLALVTVAAFALSKTPDPTALLPWVTPCITGLCSLAGGIVAGRCQKAHPVAASTLSVGLFAILLILVSLVFGGESDGILTWIVRLSVLPVHIGGGLLSRPRAKAPTHRAGKHPSHS